MARNMVTRTVHGTKVTAKVVDTASEQIETLTVTLGKKFDDNEKLKKAVAKSIPDGKILVSITETEEVEKCYGVPTEKFMELAVEINPKTRAAI